MGSISRLSVPSLQSDCLRSPPLGCRDSVVSEHWVRDSQRPPHSLPASQPSHYVSVWTLKLPFSVSKEILLMFCRAQWNTKAYGVDASHPKHSLRTTRSFAVWERVPSRRVCVCVCAHMCVWVCVHTHASPFSPGPSPAAAVWGHRLSAWRPPAGCFWSGQLAINFVFLMAWKCHDFPFRLERSFLWERRSVWWLFSFSSLKTSLHYLLATPNSTEAAVNGIRNRPQNPWLKITSSAILHEPASERGQRGAAPLPLSSWGSGYNSVRGADQDLIPLS